VLCLFHRERGEKLSNWVLEHPVIGMLLSHSNLAFGYGIFLFLYEIALLRDLVSMVHPVLLGWAGVIFLYDVCVGRIWEKLPHWKVLALFVICAGLTALTALEAGLATGIKSVIMMAVPLCAFYPVCLTDAGKKREKALIKAMLGAAVIVFLASLSAVVMYLTRFSQVVHFMGVEKLTGYRYYTPGDPSSGVLLYGFYEDTNHAAIYALVFAVYSIFLYTACKKGLFKRSWQNAAGKGFAVANVLVQMLYFPLANSRGGWLCLVVAGVMALFLFFFQKFAENGMWRRIAKSAGVSVLCIVLLCGCLLGLREGTSLISAANQTTPPQSVLPTDPTAPDVSVPTDPSQGNHGDAFAKKDTGLGSGRLWIWKDTLSLIVKRPVLGVGADYKFYAQKYGVATYSLASGKAVHNSYLDVLLANGIVGFVLMMSFWILCLASVFKKIREASRKLGVEYYCALFGVLLVAGTSFFLSSIFINTTAMYFIMLVMTGYLVAPLKGCE